MSAYTTLPKTMVVDTLDVWILDSVARNLIDLLLIFTYYQVYFNTKTAVTLSVTAGKN